MARRPQPVVLARKSPRQARAAQTVKTIFDAAARIIEEEGAAALTTNRIAERAGISIGSLYEYFPNKQAIIVAMARQLLAHDERIMAETIQNALATPGADVIRETVRAFIGLYHHQQAVRRAITSVHISLGMAEEHVVPVKAVAGLVQQQTGALFGDGSTVPPLKVFVLVRAVLGVVRSAFNERSPLLHSRELEDEIVTLIRVYASSFRQT